MTDDQIEKLKDVLAELVDQMYEISPGLPNGWLQEMHDLIRQL